jgi:hypothetical protein
MIKKLSFYDFDSTLVDSPLPETGKEQWAQHYGEPYPHAGWWGRPQSLDTDVFNIDKFESIVSLAKKDIQDPSTRACILTSRLERLRPQVEKIVMGMGLYFDEIIMKSGDRSKGDVVLSEISKYPDINRVDVYDDNYDREIVSFKLIRSQIPSHIQFNIFHVDKGNLNLIKERYNIQNIIKDEIENLIK